MHGRFHKRGGVGAAFWGDIAIDPVVTQGCRPIGVPMQVTSCDKNILIELEGKRTLKVLEELLRNLGEAGKREGGSRSRGGSFLLDLLSMAT